MSIISFIELSCSVSIKYTLNLNLRVLLKHKGLPLADGQGHYSLPHVPGREVQSPLICQSRNLFPSPRLQVQVLMNVPAYKPAHGASVVTSTTDKTTQSKILRANHHPKYIFIFIAYIHKK